jgi:hypothetical protein
MKNIGQLVVLHVDDAFNTSCGDMELVYEWAGSRKLTDFLALNVGAYNAEW